MKLSGWIQSIATWVMRLSVMNLIWFIVNIPLWFNIWSWMASSNKLSMYHYGLFLIAFPLIFIPSTMALFEVIRRWIADEDDAIGINFFIKNIRFQYRTYIKFGYIFGVLLLIWFLDLWVIAQQSETLFVIFVVVGGLLFAMMIIACCMQAYFDMSIKEIMKLSFYTTVGRPLLTLLIILTNGIIGYIVIFHIPFIIPFFSGVMMAYLSYLYFNHWAHSLRGKVEMQADE